MRPYRLLATLTTLCLLASLNAGCLSLSLFNHETADTKARLDSLEARVSALEGTHGGVPMAAPTPVSTEPVPQTAPAPPH